MNKPDIKIRFKSIEILSKTLNLRPQGDFNDEAFHFDLNGQLHLEPSIKTIFSTLHIKIRQFNKNEILGSLSVVSEFIIDNFDEVIEKIDDKYLIPAELEVLVKTMSTSTARGVLFSEFKGTYLHKAVLPIILMPSASKAKDEKVQTENSNQ